MRRLPREALEGLTELGVVLLPDGDAPLRGDAATRHLSPADAAFVSPLDEINDTMLAAAPNLKWISSLGAGLDNIDLEACARRGVRVMNAPDATTEPTADLAFALLLGAARRIAEADSFVRGGGWAPGGAPFWGVDAHHKTIGIIGMGRIGKAIARRAHGFSMRVLFNNRSSLAEEDLGIPAEACDLDSLLRDADFVMLQTPLTPATRNMIGARELFLMKRSAILINAGRGGLVDEDALCDALETAAIAYAALDVFQSEPDLNPRLRTCPNLLLTPHIGTATQASRRDMAQLALANLRHMMSGNLG